MPLGRSYASATLGKRTLCADLCLLNDHGPHKDRILGVQRECWNDILYESDTLEETRSEVGTFGARHLSQLEQTP